MAFALSTASSETTAATLAPVIDPDTGKPSVGTRGSGDDAITLGVIQSSAGGPVRLGIQRTKSVKDAAGKTTKTTVWKGTDALAHMFVALDLGLIVVSAKK